MLIKIRQRVPTLNKRMLSHDPWACTQANSFFADFLNINFWPLPKTPVLGRQKQLMHLISSERTPKGIHKKGMWGSKGATKMPFWATNYLVYGFFPCADLCRRPLVVPQDHFRTLQAKRPKARICRSRLSSKRLGWVPIRVGTGPAWKHFWFKNRSWRGTPTTLDMNFGVEFLFGGGGVKPWRRKTKHFACLGVGCIILLSHFLPRRLLNYSVKAKVLNSVRELTVTQRILFVPQGLRKHVNEKQFNLAYPLS